MMMSSPSATSCATPPRVICHLSLERMHQRIERGCVFAETLPLVKGEDGHRSLRFADELTADHGTGLHVYQ